MYVCMLDPGSSFTRRQLSHSRRGDNIIHSLFSLALSSPKSTTRSRPHFCQQHAPSYP